MKTEFLRKLLRRTDKLDRQRLVGVLEDVAEERDLLRLLFDTMQEGIVVVTPAETVSYVNQTAASILGVPADSPEQRLDRVFRSSRLMEIYRAAISGAGEVRDRDISVTEAGNERTLRVNVLPLHSAKADSKGALVVFMDITEQRRQETRLRRAEKLAALTTLSAGITHEMRNPLNALSIHLQVLRRQLQECEVENEGEIPNTISVLEREIQRLNEVMELFLKAVRPSQPEFRRVALYDLITDTLQLLRPELESKEIDVQLTEGPERPEILADDRLLQQVFINLLKNACEAIDEAGKDTGRRISIEVYADEEATTIHIRDSGAGMQEEDVDRIFEPYFTTKESGTGLGLMVCEGIIRQHGGELDVKSQPGTGTEFTITLPPPQEPTRLIREEAATAQKP